MQRVIVSSLSFVMGYVNMRVRQIVEKVAGAPSLFVLLQLGNASLLM